jgi:hypothetical protein
MERPTDTTAGAVPLPDSPQLLALFDLSAACAALAATLAACAAAGADAAAVAAAQAGLSDAQGALATGVADEIARVTAARVDKEKAAKKAKGGAKKK